MAMYATGSVIGRQCHGASNVDNVCLLKCETDSSAMLRDHRDFAHDGNGVVAELHRDRNGFHSGDHVEDSLL